MNYKITTKYIDSVKAATMHYKGPINKASKLMPNIFKSISGNANGAPFFCYYSLDNNTGISEMDLCVPTVTTPNNPGISLKNIPGQRVICLTHIGPYDELPMAYKAISKYAKEKKLDMEPPWREIFIKGPGMILKGNPKKYITEILFPIKEEA